MVVGILDGHPLSELGRLAYHCCHFQLKVETLRWAEGDALAPVLLIHTIRPDHWGTRDSHRTSPTAITDGVVHRSRRQYSPTC